MIYSILDHKSDRTVELFATADDVGIPDGAETE
jgi:hypothetical protein